MNRRSFLGTVLALATAPAIVRASSLMPVRGYAQAASGLLLQDSVWNDHFFLEDIYKNDIAKVMAPQIDKIWVTLHTSAGGFGGYREASYAEYARRRVTKDGSGWKID
jgi:hypothetical protein